MSEEYTKITISPQKINASLSDKINLSVGAAVDANEDIARAATIQKRGFTYNGDKHQGFGIYGQGLGFTGQPRTFGRGFGFGQYFSLQPFGIGSNTILGFGAGSASSMYGGKGSNVVITKTTQLAHLKMAMVIEAYKGFGIVKNVIDLMCNFASEGIKIIHHRPAIEKFYERWAEIIDLQGRIKHILRSYYKAGNVHIYTQMAKIGDTSRKKMMSTRGDTNDPEMEDRENFVEEQKSKPMGERLIPWRYVILNPFQMDIRGSKIFGQSYWVFILDEETFKKIKDTNGYKEENVDVLDETDINLPSEFLSLPRKGRAVTLDQKKLWTMHYMKDDHEDWADPMVWPVMNDIMYKHDLRAMDRSVIDSTIAATTIYKLGSAKDGIAPEPEHFKQFAQMLRTPTYTHNIVWNDAISIESNYPPVEKILNIEKYRSVDKDILAGLGVPSILVDGGEGGSFSNAFLQVRTLLEKLEDGRNEVMKWLKKQLRMIAEIMGHRDIPEVRFGNMSLRDEGAEKKLIVQLLDRGIISAERVHEVFEIETNIETERLKREKDLAEKEGIYVKHGPYVDPMTDLSPDEIMQMEHDKQKELLTKKMREQKKNKNKGPGGRPGNSGGIPQETKRDTKPKGMGLGALAYYGKIKSDLDNTYAFIENEVSDRMLKLKNVKYKKSLAKEDRDSLEDIVFAVFSNYTLDNICDKEFIDAQLQNIKINPYVYKIEKAISDSNDNAQSRRDNRVIALAQYLFNLTGD